VLKIIVSYFDIGLVVEVRLNINFLLSVNSVRATDERLIAPRYLMQIFAYLAIS